MEDYIENFENIDFSQPLSVEFLEALLVYERCKIEFLKAKDYVIENEYQIAAKATALLLNKSKEVSNMASSIRLLNATFPAYRIFSKVNAEHIVKTLAERYKAKALELSENWTHSIDNLELLMNARETNKKLVAQLSKFIKTEFDKEIDSRSFLKAELPFTQEVKKLAVTSRYFDYVGYSISDNYTNDTLMELLKRVLKVKNIKDIEALLEVLISHDWNPHNPSDIERFMKHLDKICKKASNDVDALYSLAAFHIIQTVTAPSQMDSETLKNIFDDIIKAHPDWPDYALNFAMGEYGEDVGKFCKMHNLPESEFYDFLEIFGKFAGTVVGNNPELNKLSEKEKNQLIKVNKEYYAACTELAEIYAIATGKKIDPIEIGVRTEEIMKEIKANVQTIDVKDIGKLVTISTKIASLKNKLDRFEYLQ